jgi:hypothetical protein
VQHKQKKRRKQTRAKGRVSFAAIVGLFCRKQKKRRKQKEEKEKEKDRNPRQCRPGCVTRTK